MNVGLFFSLYSTIVQKLYFGPMCICFSIHTILAVLYAHIVIPIILVIYAHRIYTVTVAMQLIIAPSSFYL